MTKKQPKYSKVEKQHLRSAVDGTSEEVEDGTNSKEIEIVNWENE